MGMILLFALLLGISRGLLFSILLMVTALFLTRIQLASHVQVWRIFTLAMGIITPSLWVIAYFYTRYQMVWDSSHGSGGPPDFSNWLQNLYISGFAFAFSPGLAAGLAFVAVLVLSPRK